MITLTCCMTHQTAWSQGVLDTIHKSKSRLLTVLDLQRYLSCWWSTALPSAFLFFNWHQQTSFWFCMHVNFNQSSPDIVQPDKAALEIRSRFASKSIQRVHFTNGWLICELTHNYCLLSLALCLSPTLCPCPRSVGISGCRSHQVNALYQDLIIRPDHAPRSRWELFQLCLMPVSGGYLHGQTGLTGTGSI